jgi:hypothetical protein
LDARESLIVDTFAFAKKLMAYNGMLTACDRREHQ